MALGDASRAQQIVVKAKGWNPNQIDEGGESLKGSNRAPEPGDYRGTPALGGSMEPAFPATERALRPDVAWSHGGDPGDGGFKVNAGEALWNYGEPSMTIPPIRKGGKS